MRSLEDPLGPKDLAGEWKRPPGCLLTPPAPRIEELGCVGRPEEWHKGCWSGNGLKVTETQPPRPPTPPSQLCVGVGGNG